MSAPEHGPDADVAADELSPEERARRHARALEEVRQLTRYALRLSAAGMVIAAVPVLLGWSGAESFLRGLIVGSLVSILNLRVLARAIWALIADRDYLRAGFGLMASFALLVGAAVLLALRFPELVLGFGVGLAVPAPAGVWFGLRLKQDDGEDRPERA